MTDATPFFVVSDPAATVLIDLSARGVAKAFGLRPNAGDTVTVGTDSRADLPVAGVGIAALQFHLERRAGVVWLRPAHGVGEMLLNDARVTGPVRLQQWCVIEFGDVRIEARILDAGKHCGTKTERFAPYAASSASQQTERMAPYRPSLGAPAKREMSPMFTANGTEVMAPVLGVPLASEGSSRHWNLELHGRTDPSIDASTSTIAAAADPWAASAPQPSSLLVHSEPSRLSQKPAIGGPDLPRPNGRHVASTLKHSLAAHRWWSNYGPPQAFVERARPTRPSLVERIGQFAKARALLAVCGGAIGAVVLAGIFLLVTCVTTHRESGLLSGGKGMPLLPLTSQPNVPTAAPAPAEIGESMANVQVVCAQSAGLSTTPATSSKTELANAVSALIAGRYDDARASYAALSKRIDSPQDYATIARLLARMTDPECSDGTRVAPQSCPQILR